MDSSQRRLEYLTNIKKLITRMREIDMSDMTADEKDEKGMRVVIETASNFSLLLAHDIVHTAKENK